VSSDRDSGRRDSERRRSCVRKMKERFLRDQGSARVLPTQGATICQVCSDWGYMARTPILTPLLLSGGPYRHQGPYMRTWWS
jgi:hypothetical protein